MFGLDFTEFQRKIRDAFPEVEIQRNKNANPILQSFITTYTVEDVKNAMTSGNVETLRDISEYFVFSSGFYNRILTYLATLMLYRTFMSPVFKNGNKMNQKKFKSSYNAALNFISKIDWEKNAPTITKNLLTYGAYFALVKKDEKGNIVFKELPLSKCRTVKTYGNGCRVLEFDLSFFDRADDAQKKELFKIFPKGIRSAYKKYQNIGEDAKWFIVEPTEGVAFVADDMQRPPFFNIIPQIINVEDYRGIEKTRDEQELHKIFVQKMPLDKEQMPVFTLEEAGELHKSVARMLRKNPNIDVITTFADTEMLSVKDTRSVIQDNIEKVEKSLYSEAGVSKEIFSPEGNLSLLTSIKNDLSYVMTLTNQYALWTELVLNSEFENSDLYFSFSFLPITYYNMEDMFNMYLKGAQSGFSKTLPLVASGLKQSEIMGCLEMENDYLKITEKLVPLQTSFTQSSNSEKVGAPTKKDDEKSDKTIQNQNAIDNGGVTDERLEI